MDFAPGGFPDSPGDVRGVIRRQVRSDLERFKRFIESRGKGAGIRRGAAAA